MKVKAHFVRGYLIILTIGPATAVDSSTEYQRSAVSVLCHTSVPNINTRDFLFPKIEKAPYTLSLFF